MAFVKALGLTNIETASELSSEILVRPALTGVKKMGRVVAKPILERLPKKFCDEFVKVAEEVTKMPFLKAVDRLGFNGIVEEIGEERVGDVLKFAFDLDGKRGYSFEQFLDAMFPPIEQLGQEALAFGVMGLGANAVDKGIRKIPKAGEKYTKEGFLLDSGIFRIKGYDSYVEKEVRGKLREFGKSEEEIENVLESTTRSDKIQFLRDIKAKFDSRLKFGAKEFEKNLRRLEEEEKERERVKSGDLDGIVGNGQKEESDLEYEKIKQNFDNWYNDKNATSTVGELINNPAFAKEGVLDDVLDVEVKHNAQDFSLEGISFDKTKTYGGQTILNGDKITIYVNTNLPPEVVEEELYHELQHARQFKEVINGNIYIEKQFNEYQKLWQSGNYEAYKNHPLEVEADLSKEYLKKIKEENNGTQINGRTDTRIKQDYVLPLSSEMENKGVGRTRNGRSGSKKTGILRDKGGNIQHSEPLQEEVEDLQGEEKGGKGGTFKDGGYGGALKGRVEKNK